MLRRTRWLMAGVAIMAALLTWQWLNRGEGYGPESARSGPRTAGDSSGLRGARGLASPEDLRRAIHVKVTQALSPGAPVPMAEVLLRSEDAEPNQRREIVGEAGLAVFPSRRIGLHELCVQARGYMSAIVPLAVRCGSDQPQVHEVALDPAPSLSVQVLPAEGLNVLGTRVALVMPAVQDTMAHRLHPLDLVEFTNNRIHMVDAASAQVRYGAVPPGVPFRFVAEHPSGAKGRTQCAALELGEDKHLTIQLEPATTIRARFPSGVMEPGSRATAWLYRLVDQGVGRIGELFVDANEHGELVFPGIEPGPKIISGFVKKDGDAYYFAISGVADRGVESDLGELQAGPRSLRVWALADQSIPAAAKAAVVLQVVPDSPVAAAHRRPEDTLAIHTMLTVGVETSIRGLPSGIIYAKASPLDADLRPVFALSPTSVTIPATGPGPYVLRMQTVVPRDITFVEVSLEAPTGLTRGLLRMRVVLLDEVGRVTIASTTPAGEGMYEFDLPVDSAGHAKTAIFVGNGHYVEVDLDASVPRGRSLVVDSASWKPAAVLTGKVIDEEGRTVAGARVHVGLAGETVEDILLQCIGTAVTKEDGTFKLDIPPDMNLYVFAQAGARTGSPKPLLLSSQKPHVRLILSGAVR